MTDSPTEASSSPGRLADGAPDFLEQEPTRGYQMVPMVGLGGSGGLLFLGSSESVEEESKLISAVDKRHRIYMQRPTQRAGLPILAETGTLLRAFEAQERARGGPVLPGRAFVGQQSNMGVLAPELAGKEERVSMSELHFKLVERFAPPSVVVNRDYEIVHISENAGRFLQFSGGEPTMNLLRVVHPNLRIELRAALFRAAETSLPVEVSGVPMQMESAQRMVDIRISPAREDAPGFLLVVFDVRDSREKAREENAAHSPPHMEPEPIVQFEREIESLKARLRDTVEQYEAGAEEQKASNEELQAMNEELRTAGEELETSRKELQSINEELATVNQELKSKVEELGHANSDLNNLITSTAIATLFLDRDFRIMRYTPSAVPLFHLIPGDVGRPLANLACELEYADISADAERVLKDLVPVEREVRAGGQWFLINVLPYRTLDDYIAGVVLTFVDITESKRATEALRESEQRLQLIIENAREYAIFAMDLERQITSWNLARNAFWVTHRRKPSGSAPISFSHWKIGQRGYRSVRRPRHSRTVAPPMNAGISARMAVGSGPAAS
jgi:two-component system CheB/CheR fusion protein